MLSCKVRLLAACATHQFTGGRLLWTSSCLCGRKTRFPYDRRFALTLRGRDVGGKPGATSKMIQNLGRKPGMPQTPGYYDKHGRFVFVPEMVPEFVVPDLKGFKLKPYVSYKVADITQSEFTARDLFNECYAKDIVKDYKDGRIKAQDLEDTDRLLEKAARDKKR